MINNARQLSLSLVCIYDQREIRYELFGGRPSVGGRPGARAPCPPPKFGPGSDVNSLVHILSPFPWRSSPCPKRFWSLTLRLSPWYCHCCEEKKLHIFTVMYNYRRLKWRWLMIIIIIIIELCSAVINKTKVLRPRPRPKQQDQDCHKGTWRI